MKKLSCILLAVMLITAMFVSCTAEVIDPYDGLAYVTFGGPASKDLSASYEVQSYESLYWFYTAEKADKFGMTGATSEETALAIKNNAPAKGLGGTIGPFSQGDWEFELYAYSSLKNGKGDGLVYSGTTKVKGLTGNSSEKPTGIPVSVTPQGEKGTIEFRNAYFRWNEDNGGEGKPTIEIKVHKDSAEGKVVYVLRSDLTANEGVNVPLPIGEKEGGKFSIGQKYPGIDVGYYWCEISAWVVESSPILESQLGIRVYGSATTVVSGDIIEGAFSFVDFEAKSDLNVIKGTNSAIIGVTPSNTPGLATTVEFEGLSAEKQYSLNVVVKDSASAASDDFSVEDDDRVAVAAIDLQLKDAESNVDASFTSAVVTTYISTGLENVGVFYNGETKDRIVSYDSNTGKLVFKTTHFSEYYVVANKVAEANGRYYGSLQDAIDAAEIGATVSLHKDVVLIETVDINKKLTINLNEKKLSINGGYALEIGENGDLMLCGNGSIVSSKDSLSVRDGGNLVVDGCKIEGRWGLIVGSRDKNNGEVHFSSAKATIKNATMTTQEASILVYDESELKIEDGVFTAKDNFVVGMDGNPIPDGHNGCSIIINGGTFNGNIKTSGYIACGLYVCNKGTVTLNGGTFNIVDGVGVLVRSGKLIVNQDVSFNITEKDRRSCGKVGDANAYISKGSAIVVDDYNYIKYPGGKPSCENNSTYEVRTASYEARIGNVYYEKLNDAVDAVPENTPTTIQILANRVEFSDSTNKVITFKGKGAKETTLKLSSNQPGAHGCSLSFVDLELKMLEINANYAGFGHASSLDFTNCVISGRGSLWGGGSVVFKDCVFNNTGDYNLWLYKGKSFVFENCNFESSVGKFINAYKENGQPASTVTITDCKFVSTKDSTEESENKYAVVYIKETSVWDVSINNMHIEGNVETGARSGSQCYEVKSGAQEGTVVSIDGNVVWKDDAPIEKTN